MASVITILNHELSPLISRFYKHDEFPLLDILEDFKNHLTQSNNLRGLEPILHLNQYNYIYVYSNNIILMILVSDNHYQTANIMCYLVFLKKFEEILKNYFKVKNLDQELIIDNYLLIYELFDEMMDFGFVQITDFNILNEYIKMKLNLSIDNHNNNNKENDDNYENFMNSSISRMSTSQISWRPKGIFYKKNEIFIDIIEKIDLLVDSSNIVKKQIINGEIKIKSYLSGMPILKLGLNEFLSQDGTVKTIDSFKKIKFDNFNFHQCVELSKFSNDNIISFIPPDGKFTLLNYKLQVHKAPLIQIVKVDFRKKILYKKVNDDELKQTKLLINVSFQTNFSKRLTATDISIMIPISFKKYKINFNNVPRFKTKIGVVVLDLEKQCLVWKISTLGGGRNFQMSSEINLLNDEDVEESELLEFDSDSDEEYYYNKDKQISERSKNIKQIFKTVQKEKQTINDTNSQVIANQETINSPDSMFSPTLPLINTSEDIFLINKNFIKITFKIENLTLSGLRINYLKIDEPILEYTSFPWVKYLSINDEEYNFKFNFNKFGPSETLTKYVKEKEVDKKKYVGSGGNEKRNSWKKL